MEDTVVLIEVKVEDVSTEVMVVRGRGGRGSREREGRERESRERESMERGK